MTHDGIMTGTTQPKPTRLGPGTRERLRRAPVESGLGMAPDPSSTPERVVVRAPLHDGVRTADGVLHEVDVLVLATGFRVDRFLRPIAVTGRDGVRLDDVWADRPSAYLALAMPHFPNLFLLNGPNGPVGNFSLIDVTEVQLAYVESLLDRLRQGAESVEVRETAAAEFEAARVDATKHTVWVTGCRSWYLDEHGVNRPLWSGMTWQYWLATRRFKASEYTFTR